MSEEKTTIIGVYYCYFEKGKDDEDISTINSITEILYRDDISFLDGISLDKETFLSDIRTETDLECMKIDIQSFLSDRSMYYSYLNFNCDTDTNPDNLFTLCFSEDINENILLCIEYEFNTKLKDGYLEDIDHTYDDNTFYKIFIENIAYGIFKHVVGKDVIMFTNYINIRKDAIERKNHVKYFVFNRSFPYVLDIGENMIYHNIIDPSMEPHCNVLNEDILEIQGKYVPYSNEAYEIYDKVTIKNLL